jgi:hypothetical protein
VSEIVYDASVEGKIPALYQSIEDARDFPRRLHAEMGNVGEGFRHEDDELSHGLRTTVDGALAGVDALFGALGDALEGLTRQIENASDIHQITEANVGDVSSNWGGTGHR